MCRWGFPLHGEERCQLGSLRFDCSFSYSGDRLLCLARSHRQVSEIKIFYIFKDQGQDLFLLIFVSRHHVRTMKKWQESHQSVELISVRNTIINLEENNNDSTNNSMRTDLQSI